MQSLAGAGKLSFKETVADSTSPEACAYLAHRTGLPKIRVKDAMNKGAVRLHRKGLGPARLRKATFRLRKGDILELCYDPTVLAIDPPEARCLEDYGHYSLWFKPANLLTQGTNFGDHGSLVRQAELFFKLRRGVYPVHRLDREVAGLVLVAHTSGAAGKLSGLFMENRVVKRYQAEVAGFPEENAGIIDHPLDGKPALTRYRVISRQTDAGTSVLEVEIETGRLHQIRRHLAAAGFPVMGDPRYGEGNKDGRPLRLWSCELAWRCPFSGDEKKFRLKTETGEKGASIGELIFEDLPQAAGDGFRE